MKLVSDQMDHKLSDSIKNGLRFSFAKLRIVKENIITEEDWQISSLEIMKLKDTEKMMEDLQISIKNFSTALRTMEMKRLSFGEIILGHK